MNEPGRPAIYTPPPEVIAVETAIIRMGWSAGELRRRAAWAAPRPVEVDVLRDDWDFEGSDLR